MYCRPVATQVAVRSEMGLPENPRPYLTYFKNPLGQFELHLRHLFSARMLSQRCRAGLTHIAPTALDYGILRLLRAFEEFRFLGKMSKMILLTNCHCFLASDRIVSRDFRTKCLKMSDMSQLGLYGSFRRYYPKNVAFYRGAFRIGLNVLSTCFIIRENRMTAWSKK